MLQCCQLSKRHVDCPMPRHTYSVEDHLSMASCTCTSLQVQVVCNTEALSEQQRDVGAVRAAPVADVVDQVDAVRVAVGAALVGELALADDPADLQPRHRPSRKRPRTSACRARAATRQAEYLIRQCCQYISSPHAFELAYGHLDMGGGQWRPCLPRGCTAPPTLPRQDQKTTGEATPVALPRRLRRLDSQPWARQAVLGRIPSGAAHTRQALPQSTPCTCKRAPSHAFPTMEPGRRGALTPAVQTRVPRLFWSDGQEVSQLPQ